MTPGDGWFVTASGLRFDTLDPHPEVVCVEDIAHALSHLCRFNGHVSRFYSVAQHSVIVSEIVEVEHEELALHALLHDAAEAYCGDVIRPIKRQLAAYTEIERRIEQAILAHFSLRPLNEAEHAIVKHADNVALVTERRDLVSPHAWRWREDERGYEPLPRTITPLSPSDARWLFLARFMEVAWTARAR